MVKSPVERKFKSNFNSLMRRKAAQEDRDITRSTVARETELGMTTIWRWANDDVHQVDADTAWKLCAYFGCSLGELIDNRG